MPVVPDLKTFGSRTEKLDSRRDKVVRAGPSINSVSRQIDFIWAIACIGPFQTRKKPSWGFVSTFIEIVCGQNTQFLPLCNTVIVYQKKIDDKFCTKKVQNTLPAVNSYFNQIGRIMLVNFFHITLYTLRNSQPCHTRVLIWQCHKSLATSVFVDHPFSTNFLGNSSFLKYFWMCYFDSKKSMKKSDLHKNCLIVYFYVYFYTTGILPYITKVNYDYYWYFYNRIFFPKRCVEVVVTTGLINYFCPCEEY